MLQALLRFSQVEGQPERPAELDPRVYGELRGVLNHYWTHLLGHPPRMHRWLSTSAR